MCGRESVDEAELGLRRVYRSGWWATAWFGHRCCCIRQHVVHFCLRVETFLRRHGVDHPECCGGEHGWVVAFEDEGSQIHKRLVGEKGIVLLVTRNECSNFCSVDFMHALDVVNEDFDLVRLLKGASWEAGGDEVNVLIHLSHLTRER